MARVVREDGGNWGMEGARHGPGKIRRGEGARGRK